MRCFWSDGSRCFHREAATARMQWLRAFNGRGQSASSHVTPVSIGAIAAKAAVQDVAIGTVVALFSGADSVEK